MKPYKCGLVVGKFSPLHKAHEQLINHALIMCDRVIVISYTNPLLGFSDKLREKWLKKLFPKAIVIVKPSEECPRNDAPGDVHRAFCATLIEEHGSLRPEIVFTSEDYGVGFAQFLSDRWDAYVEHEYMETYYRDYDIPLHATDIRADSKLWSYVSDYVKQTRTLRVCLLGGESAGKTTLAKALSERTKFSWVAEYGRKLCEELGGVANLKFEHLVQIGRKQVELEESMVNSTDSPWVICDTSPLVTKFYSQELFGKVDPELDALAKRKYDMTIVLGMSHGWHQDGDRMSPEFSMKQELWYWRQIAQAKENFKKVFFIDGPLQSRIDMALHLLENYNEI